MDWQLHGERLVLLLQTPVILPTVHVPCTTDRMLNLAPWGLPARWTSGCLFALGVCLTVMIEACAQWNGQQVMLTY